MNTVQKTYLSAAIFITAALLLFVFAVYPLLEGVKKSSKSSMSAKNELASFTVQDELRREGKALYQKHITDLERMDNLFIDPEVPLELLSFLEREAAAVKMPTDVISITSKPADKDPWPSLIIKLSGLGDFASFLRFLEKVETGPYLIEVLDVTAKKLPNGAGVDTTMSIKVYTK